MLSLRGIVFVLLLAAAGIGVDYYQQATAQGLAPGEMTPDEYLETVTARYDEWKNPEKKPERGKLPQVTR